MKNKSHLERRREDPKIQRRGNRSTLANNATQGCPDSLEGETGVVFLSFSLGLRRTTIAVCSSVR